MRPASDEKIHVSLPPSVWGPIFWNTIHIATLGYPTVPGDAEKEGMRKFFESLTTVIPCPICREHYRSHLEEMPLEPALQSRDALIHWAWDLHNRVNEMLDKKTVTEQQFIAHIRSLGESSTSSSCRTPYGAVAGGLAAGIVLGAAGLYAYKKFIK
jgi:hypothetical protein